MGFTFFFTLCSLLAGALRLHELGAFPQAEHLYLEHAALTNAVYGPHSPQSEAARLFVAAIYLSERKLSEAEQIVRGQEFANNPQAIFLLGTILAEQRHLDRATPVLKRAIFLLSKSPGSEALLSAAQENLALVYERQGDHATARTYLHQVLTANPNDGTAYAALAEVDVAEGHWDDASFRLRSARSLLSNSLGSTHPRLAGILRLEAAVKAHSGDLSGALDDLFKAQTIVEAAYGSESVPEVGILQDRASILRRMRRRSEARQIERAAHAIQSRF